MQTPYRRSSLWVAKGVSPPLIITLHSYYSLSFGWHITYQFHPRGGFYSLPENEFNLLFEPCQTPKPRESFFSKIVSRSRRLFSTKLAESSTGKKDATYPSSSSK